MRHRRRRSSTTDEEISAEAEYRTAKTDLRREINKAKTKSWNELIAAIESDPWGMPYKIVLKSYGAHRPALRKCWMMRH